jgi:hypothetical protein
MLLQQGRQDRVHSSGANEPMHAAHRLVGRHHEQGWPSLDVTAGLVARGRRGRVGDEAIGSRRRTTTRSPASEAGMNVRGDAQQRRGGLNSAGTGSRSGERWEESDESNRQLRGSAGNLRSAWPASPLASPTTARNPPTEAWCETIRTRTADWYAADGVRQPSTKRPAFVISGAATFAVSISSSKPPRTRTETGSCACIGHARGMAHTTVTKIPLACYSVKWIRLGPIRSSRSLTANFWFSER